MGEPQTIGIVGGGQLGRMLTLAAIPLGFKVVVINPSANSPAAQAGAEEIIADLYSSDALHKLAQKSDYITVEIEHLDTEILTKLAAHGKQINPSPSAISLIKDKFLQKKFFHEAEIPVAPFVAINNKNAAKKALKSFGGNMFIKARHGAYDGRGNMLVTSTADIDKAFKLFTDRQLYAEVYVPFKKELAVMVAKDGKGNIALYPVVETIHERSICVEVLAPAALSVAQKKEAEKIATKVATLLEGAGMFGVEMFLSNDGKVLLNEVAPRVHNSGHATIEANHTSQFEQHIRAITGLPLGDTSMRAPAAVMVNILGDRNAPTRLRGLSEVLKIPFVSVHMYGKSPTKLDRKMGHITATGKTLAEAKQRARQARQKLTI